MGASSDFFKGLLDLNPFAADDPSHRAFTEFASETARRHSQVAADIHARLAVASTAADYLALRLDAVARTYDLYARMFVMGSTFETLPD